MNRSSVDQSNARDAKSQRDTARASSLPPHLWPWTLVYNGTETPVPRGAPLYDQAGREWRFKWACKPAMRPTMCGYEHGEVLANNGARADRSFLVGFFPAVEFRRLAPEAVRAATSSNEQPIGSAREATEGNRATDEQHD